MDTKRVSGVMKNLLVLLLLLTGTAAGFFVVLYGYDVSDSQNIVLDGKTRCEVHFSNEKCPARPGAFEIGADNKLIDTYQNSGEDQIRCLQRATEYGNYCVSTQPVKAFFFRGSQVVATKVFRRE